MSTESAKRLKLLEEIPVSAPSVFKARLAKNHPDLEARLDKVIADLGDALCTWNDAFVFTIYEEPVPPLLMDLALAYIFEIGLYAGNVEVKDADNQTTFSLNQIRVSTYGNAMKELSYSPANIFRLACLTRLKVIEETVATEAQIRCVEYVHRAAEELKRLPSEKVSMYLDPEDVPMRVKIASEIQKLGYGTGTRSDEPEKITIYLPETMTRTYISEMVKAKKQKREKAMKREEEDMKE